MEKITQKVIHDFLENHSLKYKSTHQKLSLPIINRIYRKMVYGIKFNDIKICDDLIIDGHHRYISSILANRDVGLSKYPQSSATVAYDWKNVEFIETEWDTDDKIKYLNELDAEFNNISMEKIIKIIN